MATEPDERDDRPLAPASSLDSGCQLFGGHFSLDPPVHPGQVGALGQYELIECVGQGGMGMVFRACDTSDSREVAVKVLKPHLARDERAVAFFLKEAHHEQGLAHPHIIPVTDSAPVAGGAYLVMPFMPGGGLDKLLASGRPLDGALALRIAREVASALAFAHSRGIIHRDVKPSNILLDANQQAWLSDFGLSLSLVNDPLVEVEKREVEGTPNYLSPAAAQGIAEDTRGDIYSFGAVLYEMLTGRPAYSGETRGGVIQAILAGPPAPVRKLNPQAAAGLAAIAEGAMARELRDRYAHFSYVLADLERVEKGQEPLGPHGQRMASGKLGLRPVTWVLLVLLGTAALLERQSRVPEQMSPGPRGPRLGLAYKIDLSGIWDWRSAKIGNWYQRNHPVLFMAHDKSLLIVSSTGQILPGWRPPVTGVDGLWLNLATDTDGDGLDEPVVSWTVGKQLMVSVIGQHRTETARFTAQGTAVPTGVGGERGVSQLHARAIVDLAGDGQRQLLAVVGTGFEKKPRGIRCFDFASRKLLWERETPGQVHGVVTLDLDGDGRREVVCGTSAPDNGNTTEDGADDGHGYLYAFGLDGRPLWRTNLGAGVSVAPMVADVDGDGQSALFAKICGPFGLLDEGFSEHGEVARFNAQGEVIARHDLGVMVLSLRVADLKRDGRRAVLVTDRLGNLHVLDGALKPQRKLCVTPNRYTLVDLHIGAVADLNGDGKPELLLVSSQVRYDGLPVAGQRSPRPPAVLTLHNLSLVVLGPDLNELTRYEVARKRSAEAGPEVFVADFARDNKPDVLCLDCSVMVLEWKER